MLQRRTAPEGISESPGHEQTEQDEHGHDEGSHAVSLGEDDACRLLIVIGEVHARHHRGTDAEHQSQSRHHHPDGSHDVDGGNAVGSHSPTHEDAVDKRLRRHEQHADECGEKHLSEQRAYLARPEVDFVTSCIYLFLHISIKGVFAECKVFANERNEIYFILSSTAKTYTKLRRKWSRQEEKKSEVEKRRW